MRACNPVSKASLRELVNGQRGADLAAGFGWPLFFGWVYSLSVGERALIQMPGLAFYMAAVVLLLAAIIGWLVGRKATRQESTAAPTP